jgi:hypothetical protein
MQRIYTNTGVNMPYKSLIDYTQKTIKGMLSDEDYTKLIADLDDLSEAGDNILETIKLQLKLINLNMMLIQELIPYAAQDEKLRKRTIGMIKNNDQCIANCNINLDTFRDTLQDSLKITSSVVEKLEKIG